MTGYDAIVVGARCAGSPTAMLLARKGYRVLLVDRATFPSDTLSTHMIHAPGVAALRRWGLLEAVTATGCPPIDAYHFDFGFFTIAGTPPPSDGVSVGYAPRRYLLDKILLDAAAAAGAEVREHFSVHDLLVEDGAVVGIRGSGPDGRPVAERAPIVIGADGRNSRVARAVAAQEYMDKPRLQYSYFTYWRDLPVDGFSTVVRPDRGWAAVRTNDGLTLLVVGWPHAEATAYKADVEANYLATLELVPEFADRVRNATRVEPFSGGAVRSYLRKPFGPGWALVGDAGYNKDPITAQGISDAFRDAELCATAVDESLTGRQTFTDAMTSYQLTRDAHVIPFYEFTSQLATLAPPPPEVGQLLAAVADNRDASDDFAGVIAGTVSPVEFFAPENIARIVGATAAPLEITMTDARELTERLFAVIDGQRWSDYETVMHPDVEFTNPFADIHGVSQWIAFNRGFTAAMPDGRHSIEDVVQDGDRFAARLIWTGTHTGPLTTPQGEVPATGRTVVLPSCLIGRIRDGRLATARVYLDQLSMLAQLGLLPQPERAA